MRNLKIQMNKVIVGAIAIVAIMAIIGTYSIQNSNDSFAKKYSKNQATTQASNCGNNDALPNRGGGSGGTSCQNTNSQIQGDDNSVSLAEVHNNP
jgi:hypothetical protein